MKKIYFGCSIAGGREYANLYPAILAAIKATDVHVLCELFADKVLKPEVGTDPNITSRFVWERDVKWLSEADAVIMEVTQPSLGVGYEIAKAESLGKPLIALFYQPSGRRLSPMISGNPNVTVFKYSDTTEIKPATTDFISRL